MASRHFGPRKQRTRQHIIADLSVHYVEGFILAEGHTAQRVERDYGYDLILFTYDERGYAESGCILVQLKASEAPLIRSSDHVYDLDVRDYNRWIGEEAPVVLILFDASRRRAFWLAVQQYFRQDDNRRPKRGAKSVRVRIPTGQTVTRRAIAKWRGLKRQGLRLERGD